MRARTTGAAASWVGGWRRVRGFSAAIAAGFVIAMGFAIAPGEAATEIFTYDNAGRLISVDHGDGRVTTYTLDPAGNRTALETASGATPPATLTVPATSTTGSYSVSWTASATPGVTTYKLWEANNAAFTAETEIHSGPSPVSITGRADGTYHYRVQACVGVVCGAYRVGSNPIIVGRPPAAPASISAPATNFTGAYSVSWTAPATGTVTGYELQEATNASFTSPSNIPNSGTSATISGRVAGTTYYYRVRACNSVTCGPYTASSGTAVMAVPAPASISAPANNFTGAYPVSWTAPPSGTVSSYELQEATNASFTSPTNISFSGMSANITGRQSGTTYYYRVRACNGLGCGPYTASSGTVVTLIAPTPASLTNPALDEDGTYVVSWAAVSGPVTRYELWEANNDSFFGEARVYNDTSTSANITGRPNGADYYYRVRACNLAGCGGYLASTTITRVRYPPGVPQSITVPPTSSTGTYTISWTNPPPGGTVQYYEIQEATSPTFSAPFLTQSITLNKEFTGRTNGTYYYRVRACNGGSCGGYREGSNGIVVTTPPGAPASISFTSPDYDGDYTITWTPPPTGTVTSYELQEATNASFTSPSNIPSSGTSANITGRTSGSYYYRVRACNGGACGGYTQGSGAMSVQIIPNQPASINAPAANFTGAYVVTWTAPTTGTVTFYELQEATNVAFTSPTNIPVSGMSANITGRQTGTTYYYRVRACNGGGCGQYTASSGTAVTLVPPTPASLSNPITDEDGTYDVSWATVSGPVTNYELWEADNSSHLGEQRVHNAIGTVANRTGRANGFAYFYRVRACNAAGCSGYLASTNATTIYVPPGAPGSLTVPPTSSTGTYTISWGGSTGAQYFELFESTSPSVIGPRVAQVNTLSTQISGRTNGTYYYRVRACNGPYCGPYRESPNGIVVTIVPPSFSVNSLTRMENAGPFTFTVTKTGATTLTLSVWYATADGTAITGRDYNSTSGQLTFAPNETTKTFSVTLAPVNNLWEGGQKTFSINLSNASPGSTIATPSVTSTIVEMVNAPEFTIEGGSIIETGGSVPLTITKRPNTPTALSHTVPYFTVNGTAVGGSDFTTTSSSVTFEPAEMTKTISIQILNDAVIEGTENFTVSLGTPSGGAIVGQPGTATVTITEGGALPGIPVWTSFAGCDQQQIYSETCSTGFNDTLPQTFGYDFISSGTVTRYEVEVTGSYPYSPGWQIHQSGPSTSGQVFLLLDSFAVLRVRACNQFGCSQWAREMSVNLGSL